MSPPGPEGTKGVGSSKPEDISEVISVKNALDPSTGQESVRLKVRSNGSFQSRLYETLVAAPDGMVPQDEPATPEEPRKGWRRKKKVAIVGQQSLALELKSLTIWKFRTS